MIGNSTSRLKGARLALAGSLAVILAASILTVGSQTAASAAGLSISEAATFPVGGESAGLSTVAINPQHVGDLMILSTQIHDQAISVTGVSAPGTGTWHMADRYVDSVNNVIVEEVWWAVATATGSTTVTVVWSGDVSADTPELVADSFTTASGATWSAVTGTGLGAAGTNTTTIVFPSLTSNTDPNQMYWGYAEDTMSINVPGPSSGYTYSFSPVQNLLVSNLALSPSVSNTPPPASTVSAMGNYTSIGVIFAASPTVTFNGNGSTGGSMSPEVANAPTTLTANAFTRTNYTFAGWNTALNGSGTAYADGASYPFSAGATLYAQWTADSHTVTFNGNGSTGGSMSPEIHNAPTALTANAFTLTGLAFAGWNTLANGLGTAYADGATYPFTADVTLYAQWTNNHTVTFNGNNSTGGSMSPEVHNAPTALTANAFTRTNYTFEGWNTAPNGTGTGYADGATYSFSADAILYAQWAANFHTVAFNGNGSTAGLMSPEVADSPAALTANAFTRTGYSFAGWNTSPNGMGTAYADGATYAFSADATLYAQWAASSHTVTFNGNGSTGGSMSPEVANAPTALTANAFTRTGYSFAGWNTSPNGMGTAYANGATYAFSADATLYAQWTASSHTVTFNGNGSTGGSMSPEVANAPTALTANAFTRTGYTFAGWNTAPDGSGTAYADGATYPFSADATLYAKWSKIPSPAPHAIRLIGSISAGTTHIVTIVGTGFTGTSRVFSNAAGTTIKILHVTNTHVEVRVTVKKGSRGGTHTLKIVLHNGKSCTIKYVSH